MTNSTNKPIEPPRRAAFISHASKNYKVADEIRRLLEERGLDCWIAPRDIPAGSSYGEQIASAIEQCGAVVLVMTEEANQSRAVANELELAFRNQRVIIPVRLKEVEPARSLQFFVSNAQWVDARFTPLKKRVDEIANIVRAARSGSAIPRPAPEQKTLLGSAERFLEGAIRYKMLTLSAVGGGLLTIGGVSAFLASSTTARLDAEQAKIDHDPATFGLVTIKPADEGTSGGAGAPIDLHATIYVNLRDPAKGGLELLGRAATQSGANSEIDLQGVRPFTASGAQIALIRVPGDTSRVSFCMSAQHPTLKGRYAATWVYSVTEKQGYVTVDRSEEPRLLGQKSADCKVALQ